MLARPLQIGPVPLRTNLLLAPIAGYCDLAFRTICREWGGVGLACTDLLSPQGLLRGTATSLDLAKTNDFDKPVGMQLYGSDPDIMAEGARWAVEHGATVVDINMGCPVDKVTKKDGGSKLLTDLSRAARIVERVARELEKLPLSAEEWEKRVGAERHSQLGIRHSTGDVGTNAESRMPNAVTAPGSSWTVPLTCKIRLCWHTADYEAGTACSPGLASALADAGVKAVTVHGRTTEDKFQGTVRLEGIARVVDAVNGRIPIIGNGDVREPADAERMLRVTGCDGVMIGRGALSTPWLFRDAWAHLCEADRRRGAESGQLNVERGNRTGDDGRSCPDVHVPLSTSHVEPLSPPTLDEKVATVRRYFELMRDHREDRYAMFQIRRRISWFAKRLMSVDPSTGKVVGVKPLKEAVRNAETPAQVHEALDRFLAGGLRGGAYEQEEAGV